MRKNDFEMELRNNGSGCPDPTAYKAIKKIDKCDADRFHDLIHAVFALCDANDFHLENRIVVKDRRTGKIWR